MRRGGLMLSTVAWAGEPVVDGFFLNAKWGPWIFEKNLVILAKVCNDVNPLDGDLNRCAFYVHVHGLPLHMMMRVDSNLARCSSAVEEMSADPIVGTAGIEEFQGRGGCTMWPMVARVPGGRGGAGGHGADGGHGWLQGREFVSGRWGLGGRVYMGGGSCEGQRGTAVFDIERGAKSDRTTRREIRGGGGGCGYVARRFTEGVKGVEVGGLVRGTGPSRGLGNRSGSVVPETQLGAQIGPGAVDRSTVGRPTLTNAGNIEKTMISGKGPDSRPNCELKLAIIRGW
ncbi:hypothetical protein Salat_1739400 [Sesamum alatum]|uniref:Uncharacterized protein n=1 Tax=Sesamum alatum TaxID=300844 RepID=A0AAE1Y848_9LAMI|nr:hypothetical protein Salat_1739400 [Sesamum alatum]